MNKIISDAKNLDKVCSTLKDDMILSYKIIPIKNYFLAMGEYFSVSSLKNRIMGSSSSEILQNKAI